MSWVKDAIDLGLAGLDLEIDTRFRNRLVALELKQPVLIADMLDAVDRIGARIEQSQRGLVAANIQTDFYDGEMRDALVLRKLFIFLDLISRHEVAVGNALRLGAAKKRIQI